MNSPEENQGFPYEDIIDLPGPLSRRARMPMKDRAGQFAPFAALSGFGEAVDRTGQDVLERMENPRETEAWLETGGNIPGDC